MLVFTEINYSGFDLTLLWCFFPENCSAMVGLVSEKQKTKPLSYDTPQNISANHINSNFARFIFTNNPTLIFN